jgi:hypothetical protein
MYDVQMIRGKDARELRRRFEGIYGPLDYSIVVAKKV